MQGGLCSAQDSGANNIYKTLLLYLSLIARCIFLVSILEELEASERASPRPCSRKAQSWDLHQVSLVLSQSPCRLSLPFPSAQDPFFFKWCAHHISNLMHSQAQLLGKSPLHPDVRELRSQSPRCCSRA